eukprot:SAG11_NODE_1960_length_3998_cov_3.835599_2_plen_63_part_00
MLSSEEMTGGEARGEGRGATPSFAHHQRAKLSRRSQLAPREATCTEGPTPYRDTTSYRATLS